MGDPGPRSGGAARGQRHMLNSIMAASTFFSGQGQGPVDKAEAEHAPEKALEKGPEKEQPNEAVVDAGKAASGAVPMVEVSSLESKPVEDDEEEDAEEMKKPMKREKKKPRNKGIETWSDDFLFLVGKYVYGQEIEILWSNYHVTRSITCGNKIYKSGMVSLFVFFNSCG